MQTIQELQNRVYSLWLSLHALHECVTTPSGPLSDPTFQTELATYGSPQLRTSWEQAFASLYAKFLSDAALDDSQFLIEFYLVEAAIQEGWENLFSSVVERLLEIPAAAEALAYGWQKIRQYGCQYTDSTLFEEIGRQLGDYQAESSSERRRLEQTQPTDSGDGLRLVALP